MMRSPTLTSIDKLGAVVERAAGADRTDHALLRLLFCRVRKKHAAGALILLLDVLNDHAIAQRLEIHEKPPVNIQYRDLAL